MSSNIVNQVAFLRTSREYPEQLHQLSIEVDKSYVDIANAVNVRTIGLFPVNRPAITGDSWFITARRQQSFRQIYPFTTTAAIDHGLNFTEIERFTRTFGEFTDGTNWYGLIPGSNIAIAGQISFYVTPTQIIFMVGGGAPAVTKGTVVLEWLSQV